MSAPADPMGAKAPGSPLSAEKASSLLSSGGSQALVTVGGRARTTPPAHSRPSPAARASLAAQLLLLTRPARERHPGYLEVMEDFSSPRTGNSPPKRSEEAPRRFSAGQAATECAAVKNSGRNLELCKINMLLMQRK
ncbi:uncharacterized protein LOC119512619 isoform X2 [Choloepus didactylus]|uniref:uncharacterized protein LOC119512619 isoform X2 n=1 Tax=Choloepus didactylus TaxID=27675 RepID=UPI00189D65B0|nr:uncharacterized protein LOC119512619 isoform X2 [Choloepus didactylus]